MHETDVRDISGRFRRVVIASFAGLVASLGITILLPTRDHFPTPPGGCGFSHQGQGWLVEGGSPSMMIAGAIVLAVFAYIALGAISRAVSARRDRAGA